MAAAQGGEPAEWTAIIEAFVRDHVRRAGAGGVVLGLSGGLDSAVAAALCARALGPDRVHGFAMPAADSSDDDARDAAIVAQDLGITLHDRPIAAIVAAAADGLGGVPDAVRANLKSRARMLVLYAEAQQRGWLVCGTGNKSELLVGYFTKHGDGGNDMQPLGDLYKTQVFALARWLGLPDAIIEKPPSAGLQPGQTDEAELGMGYVNLDAILKGIELNESPDAIARRTGLPRPQIDAVVSMVRRSEHKRRPPLVPKIGARTVGIDWRRPVHWDA